MLSECARTTTPEEARFRVDYPNSAPRRIKIIALDQPAERVVRRLAARRWNSATFMTAVKTGAPETKDWLADLAGHALNLLEQEFLLGVSVLRKLDHWLPPWRPDSRFSGVVVAADNSGSPGSIQFAAHARVWTGGPCVKWRRG